MKHNETDIENIHRVLNGDTAAFRYLVEQYRDMVFTLALKIVGTREEAEDVAQEVFVKCYKSLNSYNQKSQFATWLYRITYNHSIDTLKKNRKNKVVSELKDHLQNHFKDNVSSEDNIDNRMLQSLLKEAMAQLPAADRVIIILYYYDDQPLREIANVLGIKENHAKIKLHRIRSKLHEQLHSKKEIISTLIS